MVLLVVCALVRPARADLAGAIYGDVRDVVEELIQTEVTASVVATVKQRSPALAFYMRGTLERLASPYWGSLGRVLKDDLTVVVSDFVYWHLSTGGGDGDVIASARRFFGCVTARADAPPANDACARLVSAVGKQYRPLIEVECRRAKPAQDRRVACHVGLAVLAALEGRGEVRRHLVDALADIVLSEAGDRDLGNRLRDVLTRWLDQPRDLPTPLLEALGNPDLAAALSDDAIDKRCENPELVDTILKDPFGPLSWVCFAVTHKALPKALGAKIVIKEGKNAIEVPIDYWIIQAALKDYDADRASDDSAFRLLAELAFDARCPAGNSVVEAWPCKGARLAPGASVSVSWLGRNITGTIGASGVFETRADRAMVIALLRFRKLIRRIEELRGLVPPTLSNVMFYAGKTPVDARAALRSAHRMARLVTELRSRWYLWAQNTKSFEELDVAELLNVARESLGSARGEAANALAFLDKQATGGAATLDIGDWLRLVMRADYRSLAMESLRAALDLRLADASRPRETFFLTLAAYLLDTGEGVNEAVARSAFRAAAKDLLLSATTRGVPRVGDRVRFRFMPRLAMRLSFNDTYAITDGDTRRYVIAADWPTFMVAITDFVGVEASLLDPVAPLSEMALRPPGTYARYEYVALDVLRPRIGVWIAVPQFSRRLALTSGFGARFVALTRSDDGSQITASYGYDPSLTFDAGLQFVF